MSHMKRLVPLNKRMYSSFPITSYTLLPLTNNTNNSNNTNQMIIRLISFKKKMKKINKNNLSSIELIKINKREEEIWANSSLCGKLLYEILRPETPLGPDPVELKDWKSYFENRYPDWSEKFVDDEVAMRVLSKIFTFPLTLSYGLNSIFPIPKEYIKVIIIMIHI